MKHLGRTDFVPSWGMTPSLGQVESLGDCSDGVTLLSSQQSTAQHPLPLLNTGASNSIALGEGPNTVSFSPKKHRLCWALVNCQMLDGVLSLLQCIRKVISYCFPVALTSLLCKFLERIISAVINNHLNTFGLLNPHRHGFVKHRICVTQLVNILHSWSSTPNRRHPSRVDARDMSKAFDTMPHHILLNSLLILMSRASCGIGSIFSDKSAAAGSIQESPLGLTLLQACRRAVFLGCYCSIFLLMIYPIQFPLFVFCLQMTFFCAALKITIIMNTRFNLT